MIAIYFMLETCLSEVIPLRECPATVPLHCQIRKGAYPVVKGAMVSLLGLHLRQGHIQTHVINWFTVGEITGAAAAHSLLNGCSHCSHTGYLT